MFNLRQTSNQKKINVNTEPKPRNSFDAFLIEKERQYKATHKKQSWFDFLLYGKQDYQIDTSLPYDVRREYLKLKREHQGSYPFMKYLHEEKRKSLD